MIDEQFTPQERALIERLQHAPQRRLASAKADAIEARILNAVDMPVPTSRPPLSAVRTFAVVVAAVLIAVIILVVNSQSHPQQAATLGTKMPVKTAASTETNAPPTFTAVSFVVTDSLVASPSPSKEQITTTTSPTASAPETVVVVEGPVRDIQANRITIYDLTVQVAPDDPMLNIIKVGDMVHIKGTQVETGVIVALQVSNVIGTSTGGGTALVDGRVQAVDGNMLTINGIKVQLSPDDPRLKTIRVGNFLSVNGNFARQGTTVVLIVVNLVIINDADVEIYQNCRKSKAMGMSMGMGDDGMGMGMGNDGMGSADCP